MAKNTKKTAKAKAAAQEQAEKAGKIHKQEKRKLRAEADAMRFQRTDSKSWDDTRTRAAIKDAPVENKGVNIKQPMKHQSGALAPKVDPTLAPQASIILSMAAGVGVLMGMVLLGLEGGREAVHTIGGVAYEVVPQQTAQIILTLDTLFPIFFGAGLAILATSMQSRGNRPLVRVILTALLVAVVADFSENALAFGVMNGGEAPMLMFPLTLVKYAGLAFAGVMLSAIAPREGTLGTLAHLLLRYAFPVFIAMLVSGIGGEAMRMIVGASFPLSLLLLALYAGSFDAEAKS